MKEWIKKMWRSLHPDCPACEEGKMWRTKAHMCMLNVVISIWTCDKCGEQYI